MLRGKMDLTTPVSLRIPGSRAVHPNSNLKEYFVLTDYDVDRLHPKGHQLLKLPSTSLGETGQTSYSRSSTSNL